jgi:Na+/melibiose symporter-like transporter
MVAVLAAPLLLLGQGAPLVDQLSIMGGLLLLVVPLTVLPSLALLPHGADAETSEKPKLSGAWQLLRDSPALRRLLAADLLSGGGYAANSATSFFVISQLLSVGDQYSSIMLCFMLAMIAGIPVFLKLSLWKGPHASFAFAMIGAALGMTDNNESRPQIGEHLRGDVAGVGARRFHMAILPANGYPPGGAGDGPAHKCCRGTNNKVHP